jgi:hypothetical protein
MLLESLTHGYLDPVRQNRPARFCRRVTCKRLCSPDSGALSRIESGCNHLRFVIRDPKARVAAISKAEVQVDKEVVDGQLLALCLRVTTPSPRFPFYSAEVLTWVFHFLASRAQEDALLRRTESGPPTMRRYADRPTYQWHTVREDCRSLCRRLSYIKSSSLVYAQY